MSCPDNVTHSEVLSKLRVSSDGQTVYKNFVDEWAMANPSLAVKEETKRDLETTNIVKIE